MVRGVGQVTDTVFTESSCARAVAEMQKFDPDFDIEELTYEAEEIFSEFYCNFLAGSIEYMEMVCASTALGVTKGTIQLRQKEGWEYKCKELLRCGQAIFTGGQVVERVP
jgi:hypothetical protein